MEIMAFKKKTQLAIAYTFLFSAAGAVVTADSLDRRSTLKQPTAAPTEHIRLAPYPMTCLADSPFLKGRVKDGLPVATLVFAETTEGTRDRHVAPFGIYYLRVPVSTDTEDGPVTFGPGTQVRLVRHQAGKIRVTRNGVDFLVEEKHVTNDLDAVATLARSSS